MPPGLWIRAAEGGFQTFYLASALTSCFGDKSRLDTCFMSKFIARHKIILSEHPLPLTEFVAIGGSEEMLQTPGKELRSPGPGFIHTRRTSLPVLEAGAGAATPSPSPTVASAPVDIASLLSRGLGFTCGN